MCEWGSGRASVSVYVYVCVCVCRGPCGKLTWKIQYLELYCASLLEIVIWAINIPWLIGFWKEFCYLSRSAGACIAHAGNLSSKIAQWDGIGIFWMARLHSGATFFHSALSVHDLAKLGFTKPFFIELDCSGIFIEYIYIHTHDLIWY